MLDWKQFRSEHSPFAENLLLEMLSFLKDKF